MPGERNDRWYGLTDEQFNELIRLSRLYGRETQRCHESKAYLAGCVMAGASLEAQLIAMVHLYGKEVDDAGLVPTRQRSPVPILDWKMPQLLDVAARMGWLPRELGPNDSLDGRRANIGDYADGLRQIRNYVHPGRYVQDHSPSRVTKRYTRTALEILDIAVQWLGAAVEKSIAERLEDDDCTNQ